LIGGDDFIIDIAMIFFGIVEKLKLYLGPIL